MFLLLFKLLRHGMPLRKNTSPPVIAPQSYHGVFHGWVQAMYLAVQAWARLE
jgi:hypothetical protein